MAPDEGSPFIDSGEDRISNLDENVISHILSRLLTKEAVQTCVLSKDWKYKWTSIYNWEIDDMVQSRNGTSNFVAFMESILLFSVSDNVRSFIVSCCEEYDLSRVSTWISVLLGRNIETFKLFYAQQGLVLPQMLLTCTSLRTLKLNSQCTLKVHPVNSFPNLTKMDLTKVEFLNECSSTNTLVLQFPVLKMLAFSHCKWLNVKFVEIYGPALTDFKYRADYDAGVKEYSIKILGADLEIFCVNGHALQNNFILTGSTVNTATLLYFSIQHQLIGDFGLQVRRLMQQLSSAKILQLTGCTELAMAIPNLRLPLPTYYNLERLEIQKCVKFKSLLELLHAAPILKFLYIRVIGRDYECDAVEFMPPCILSSLEEVEFYSSYRYKPKFHLEKILLENGKQLKKFTFRVTKFSLLVKDEFVKELSTLNKASTSLTIVV